MRDGKLRVRKTDRLQHLWTQLPIANNSANSRKYFLQLCWPPFEIVSRRNLPCHTIHRFIWAASTHILNTPNFVAGTGAFSAAENASASTRRVSPGRMMPSSQSRAVA